MGIVVIADPGTVPINSRWDLPLPPGPFSHLASPWLFPIPAPSFLLPPCPLHLSPTKLFQGGETENAPAGRVPGRPARSYLCGLQHVEDPTLVAYNMQELASWKSSQSDLISVA